MNSKDTFSDIYPQSLTRLPTYKCNAACEQCCFESNPQIKHKASLESIKNNLESAKKAFPSLKLIVFSGGEVFLLKDKLFDAIKHARHLGFQVRCVTNAFWAKTKKNSDHISNLLAEADISEINISTGADHQKFVPFESVENACESLTAANIPTLVTVEADADSTKCLDQAKESQIFRTIFETRPHLFSLQSNSWMPFHEGYEERGTACGLDNINDGCTQVFNNIVITPYGRLAACCGLTFEHIPEMTLGEINETHDNLSELFSVGYNDFIKIWIHVDGPGVILKKIFGNDIPEDLKNVRHICQACAFLHLNPSARDQLKRKYIEFVPEVVARFTLKTKLLADEGKISSRNFSKC